MNSSPTSRAFRAVLVAGVTFAAPFTLPAQRTLESSDARIKHREKAGEISVEQYGRQRRYKPGDAIPLRARPKDDVKLIVTDPNNFVFTYKLGERTEAYTADYEALKKLAEALAGIFKQPAATPSKTEAVAIQRVAESVSAGGVTVKFEEGRKAASELATALGTIVNLPSLSLTRPLTDADFNPVEVEGLLGTIDQLLAFFGEVEIAMLRLQSPLIIVSYDDGSLTRMTAEDFWQAFAPLRPVFDVRQRLAILRDGVRAFVADYKAYLQDRPGRLVATVTVDAQKDITQPVIIAPNPAYANDPAVKAEQASFAGTYNFVISPAQSFHYRIGAGLIYSFVRNPDYSVATAADGTLTITEKSADYNEVGGAVALNIYPDRFFHEGVKWFGQIGASPAKDAHALFAGAGFFAFEKFTLAAGLIYQQRRELGGGQTVGATLAKAEDLNVRVAFKAGFYVQLGVDF